MLALHLHFLTGRYAATAYSDRYASEWPPHPARIYSALVDAFHAADCDRAEAEVLELLAHLPPPLVVASAASERRVMTHFVPVNDVAVTDSKKLHSCEERLRTARVDLDALGPEATAAERKKAENEVVKAAGSLQKAAARQQKALKRPPEANPAFAVLPWSRTKQPRTFPVTVPVVPVARIIWPDGRLTTGQLDALKRVTGRVARIGHSSSFVHVRVEASDQVWDGQHDADLAVWRPDSCGSEVLRCLLPTQRRELERAYAHHQGELPGRVLPAKHVRYSVAGEIAQEGSSRRTFGRWIAYRFLGNSLPPSSAAVPIAEAVRSMLLRYASTPDPILTGRAPDGSPLQSAHVAVLSLPFVGHRHADGSIRGFAISVPPECDRPTELLVLKALGAWEADNDDDDREVTLMVGSQQMRAERVLDEQEALKTLRLSRWSRASHRWATVTPIALDGHCDRLNHPNPAARQRAHKTAGKLIRGAVLRAVLSPVGCELKPEDIRVRLVFDCPIIAGPHLRSFPLYQRPGHDHPRRLVHAVITLPFPVRGPLLLGSGRHFGLGLCLPLDDRSERRRTVNAPT